MPPACAKNTVSRKSFGLIKDFRCLKPEAFANSSKLSSVTIFSKYFEKPAIFLFKIEFLLLEIFTLRLTAMVGGQTGVTTTVVVRIRLKVICEGW